MRSTTGVWNSGTSRQLLVCRVRQENSSVQKTLESQAVAVVMLGLLSVTTTDLLHQSPASVVALSDKPATGDATSPLHMARLDIGLGGPRGEADASSCLA
jgi:hypothetical protein